jgi:hypothetical protein
LVKEAFGVNLAKPTNHHEVKQLFVTIVKATTTKDLVVGKQLKTNTDGDVTAYTLNGTLMKHHAELNGLKNESCKGISQNCN